MDNKRPAERGRPGAGSPVNANNAVNLAEALEWLGNAINHALERTAVRMFVPPESDCELRMVETRVRRGERIPPFETRRLRKEGTCVDVAVSVSPIADATGAIIGVWNYFPRQYRAQACGVGT